MKEFILNYDGNDTYREKPLVELVVNKKEAVASYSKAFALGSMILCTEDSSIYMLAYDENDEINWISIGVNK